MGDNSMLKQKYNYLVSHLSNDAGVVGFETLPGEEGTEMLTLWFVDTLTVPDRIFAAVNADSLLLHYADGSTGSVANPFRFNENGTVIAGKVP
jgi:hypothetical protein